MQNAGKTKSFPFSLLLGASMLIVGGLLTVNSLRGFPLGQKPVNEELEVIKIKTVTGLGRLEPSGEIIHVSAPLSNQGNRLEQLLVKEGDNLVKGQIIGILDNQTIALKKVQEGEETVKLADAKLAQINAGAKLGEIKQQEALIEKLQAELQGTEVKYSAKIARLSAQLQGEKTEKQAIIERLEAELSNVEREFQRYLFLAQEGAISQSDLDFRRLNVDTTRKKLKEAKASLEKSIETITQEIKETQAQAWESRETLQKQIEAGKADLDAIKEIRAVDVDVILAQLKQAQATLSKAKAELDLTYIKAPQDGQVLKVLTHEGETVSNQGIVRMGETKVMYAVGEIYESDISKIHLGQKAVITSNGITGELKGTVEKIGLEVQRQEVINSDPSANIDGKIVEVKIKLDEDSSQKVKGLTNLLVKVSIIL
jgi:HlyD family secretion protein